MPSDPPTPPPETPDPGAGGGASPGPEGPARPGRRGRPPTGRRVQVNFVVTPEEKAALGRLAADAELSVSEFLRRRALGRPVRARTDAAVERQMWAVGVTLNQLARVANRAGQVERASELGAALDELRAAIAALRRGERGGHGGGG